MGNRFDFEQALMAAWTTEDDLALLAEHTLEYADGYDIDDVVNALLGLQRLHHMRMQKVWQIFETLVDGKAFGDFADDEMYDEAEDADDELPEPGQKYKKSNYGAAQDCKWPRDSER